MRIVITGGCGFLGRRVALQLLGRDDVDELVLFDNAPSALPLPEDKRVTLVTGDIADRVAVGGVISRGTASVLHLAAVVSGQAE
ncbi:MAG: NAD-dependent epimerase/dehydratase family protein, partial [Alphaproteobacteria bacterium]|nr:NAD-dependent epimerase/dehydratase family protein [Alphaproteobacteria bacterium]